jgi:hypothetical protein
LTVTDPNLNHGRICGSRGRRKLLPAADYDYLVSVLTGLDTVAIDADLDQIRTLRVRLGELERRKTSLVRLQGRMSDFQSVQASHAETVRSSFPKVRFAGKLAHSLNATVTGPSFYAADSQMSLAVREVSADIETVQDRIDDAQRRLTVLRAGG